MSTEGAIEEREARAVGVFEERFASGSSEAQGSTQAMAPESPAGNTFIRHGAKHYKASTGLVV
ncbi:MULTISPECIES: hypothetical protein [Methanoculleus]|uniref:Uncharacterized protein n=1 Tax=Methanoculleus submarinus TaxID=204050 RepID=A0AAX3E745_9EURY|nr:MULTISPECIES: hypothetical protein [Methanoculleus]MCC7555698.1 hypothetical protein [Methanoculleus marisnigri]UYU18039.1 hypothetical protein OH143_10065 [Methanoculleus submarinus]